MDGIEGRYKSHLVVIRLDIQSESGRTLAPLYDFQHTPTFIFFDARGKEL